MPERGGGATTLSPTAAAHAHAAADWGADSEAGHAANAPHLASPRKRRERDRHASASLGGAASAGGTKQGMAFCGRVEARYVAFVGMFFVTLTAASLYSLLAPFFPSVAGAWWFVRAARGGFWLFCDCGGVCEEK
jgi:hypothetical protein